MVVSGRAGTVGSPVVDSLEVGSLVQVFVGIGRMVLFVVDIGCMY